MNGRSEYSIEELPSNGFAVLDDFCGPDLVAELTEAVESLAVDEESSRVRRGAMFARRNLLELDFVRRLIASGRVRELVDSIEPGSIAVRAILFDKNGSANWTVPWHQDRSIAVCERLEVAGFGPWSTKAGVVHVQPPVELLRRMVTLRFHLDPCGLENGPLRVVSGTHTSILGQEEMECALAERAESPCVTGAGGVVIMRPLILHASSPAKKPSHRRVIHIEFGPRVLPGGLSWAKTAG